VIKSDRKLTAFKRKYVKFERAKRRQILFEPNLRLNKHAQIYPTNLSEIKFKYFASNFQPNLQKLPYKKEINLLNFTKFAQNIDIKKPFG